MFWMSIKYSETHENDPCKFSSKNDVLYQSIASNDICAMVKTIHLSEVLTIMKKLTPDNKPIPFSIEVRTYNRQKKQGGNIKFWPVATLMQAPKIKGVQRLSQKIDFKNPNHFKNRTRNLSTPEGERKINILFIIKFNGYKVVY